MFGKEQAVASSVFLEGVLSVYLEGVGLGLCMVGSLDSSLVTWSLLWRALIHGKGSKMCG